MKAACPNHFFIAYKMLPAGIRVAECGALRHTVAIFFERPFLISLILAVGYGVLIRFDSIVWRLFA